MRFPTNTVRQITEYRAGIYEGVKWRLKVEHQVHNIPPIHVCMFSFVAVESVRLFEFAGHSNSGVLIIKQLCILLLFRRHLIVTCLSVLTATGTTGTRGVAMSAGRLIKLHYYESSIFVVFSSSILQRCTNSVIAQYSRCHVL